MSITDCRKSTYISPYIQARRILNLKYKALAWTVSRVGEVRSGIPDRESEGIILGWREMQILGIDSRRILDKLAKGEFSIVPYDYWNYAIVRYRYRIPGNKAEWNKPCMFVPKNAVVCAIMLRANPNSIPFGDIQDTFCEVLDRLGIPKSQYRFIYDELPIESTAMFASLLRESRCDLASVHDELRAWRDRVLHCIRERIGKDSQLTESATGELDGDDPAVDDPEEHQVETTGPVMVVPNEIVGVKLSRPELARIMGKTPRTLKGYDNKGCVPTGITWAGGIKVSGNLVLYDIAKNWRAIQSMVPRDRDKAEDMQLLEEIHNLNHV